MTTVVSRKIKYEGMFDKNGLFELIKKGFVDRGFLVHEKKIAHAVKAPLGDEEMYSWIAESTPTDYVKYTIKIEINFMESRVVELAVDGKKKTTHHARIVIEFTGDMDTDWQGQFKSSFTQKLKNWVEANVIDPDLQDLKEGLAGIVIDVFNEVKVFLGMQTA